MFGSIELKQTLVYQEAKLEGKLEGKSEGKLESIPKFLEQGLSVEIIAKGLNLPLEVVQKAAKEQNS